MLSLYRMLFFGPSYCSACQAPVLVSRLDIRWRLQVLLGFVLLYSSALETWFWIIVYLVWMFQVSVSPELTYM